jgi:hypothetical protein
LQTRLDWRLQRAFRQRARPLQAARRAQALELLLPESMVQPENMRRENAPPKRVRPPTASVEPPEVEAQLPAWLLPKAPRAASASPLLLSVA